MTAWHVDEAIGRIARRQHGVFSDRQARGAGASHRIIRQCMAATLALPDAAISHKSAAALYELKGFRPGPIHVVVRPGKHRTNPLATVHRSSWPRLTYVEGIRTVRLADTFFQLAGSVDERRLRSAFEDAAVVHTAFVGEMADRVVELAHSRLPGARSLRRLVADHAGDGVPASSELERQLDRLLAQVEGMPAWHAEAPLPGWGDGEARVDRLVPDWRLIVEADGRRWHTRLADFERDRWRDNVATAHGYDILRFTYARLVHQRIECVALLEGYAARHRTAA